MCTLCCVSLMKCSDFKKWDALKDTSIYVDPMQHVDGKVLVICHVVWLQLLDDLQFVHKQMQLFGRTLCNIIHGTCSSLDTWWLDLIGLFWMHGRFFSLSCQKYTHMHFQIICVHSLWPKTCRSKPWRLPHKMLYTCQQFLYTIMDNFISAYHTTHIRCWGDIFFFVTAMPTQQKEWQLQCHTIILIEFLFLMPHIKFF